MSEVLAQSAGNRTSESDAYRELIYDWNTLDAPKPTKRVEFDDESLRDGLQSPSVTDPPIEKKLRILHLMESLGIDTADLGLPGAGPRAVADVTRLVSEIIDNKLKIVPNAATRTHKADIIPIIEIANKLGRPVEAAMFIGSSPVRQYTEDWTLDRMLRMTEEAVSFAVQNGIPVMYVTEDTTRAHPDTIRALYKTAVAAGAYRICVCDTVGHATPHGVRALVNFVRREIIEPSGDQIKLDWHGHRDRGLDVVNSVTAVEAGVDRVHGAGLGIGERAGNTPMDQLLVNLQLMGYIDRDLSRLGEYVEAISDACCVPLPDNYPVFGRDAFRTATGVHAAAVIKAFRKGDRMLADLIYSGVPAQAFGRGQVIEIGPMSGKSNVVYWLEKRGHEAAPELVEHIFNHAKQVDHTLTDQEVYDLMKQTRQVAGTSGD